MIGIEVIGAEILLVAEEEVWLAIELATESVSGLIMTPKLEIKTTCKRFKSPDELELLRSFEELPKEFKIDEGETPLTSG